MKKLTFWKSLFLLCALIVGSTSAWADNVNVINENFSTNNTTDKITNAGWTLTGKTSAGTGYLQIASGKGEGSATTPAFSNLAGTEATLSVTHISSGKDSRTLTVTGVNCKVNGKASTTVTVNGNESSANTSTIAITEASTTSKITFSAANGAGTKLNSVTVYYTTSSSTLASIALTGTYPTSFAVGDAFSHEGMTVTATYEDESTNDVTSKASFTGYNMSSTGTQEVTVSYTESDVTKTAKYNITVKALANLAFSPASKNVALNGEEIISFSKSTDADVDFEVEDETIATYDPLTGKVRGLKEGTTKITATSAETSSYAAGSATCTIKVIDPSWIDLTAQGYDNADDVTEVEGFNGSLTFDVGTNSNSNGPKWYDSGSAVRLYTGNTVTIQAKTGFLLTDIEFSVPSGSMDKDNFSETVTNSGNKFTLSTPANEITYSTGSNFRIDKVKLTIAAPVTISTAEYATFVNATHALDFSETDITVYTAEDKATSVGLNEVTSGKVPANTPVVLYKSSANGTAINVPVIVSADAIEGTNDLHVSTGTDVANMYVLAKKNSKVGFYKWAGTTDLSAGKIYLQGKASYGAREFLGFDDTATGIANIDVNANDNFDENAPAYNLAGQRVNATYKGVVIVNGKKIVRK